MNLSAVPGKRLLKGSILGVTLCLVALPSYALTVQEVPNPRQISGNWVTDSAEILRPATEAQLNQMIQELEQKNGAEIAVVTVPETKPAASPKAFATELFNYWHIGKKGQDNGVLFLISPDDRRVEIETGYGVEAILPDAKVGNIIQTQILPPFKQGDFDAGALAGTQSLVRVLQGDGASSETAPQPLALPSPQSKLPAEVSQPQPDIWGVGFAGGLGSLFLLVLVLVARRPKLIEPEGYSQWNWTDAWRLIRCARCQQPLKLLEDAEIKPYLNHAQVVARNIGSTVYKGWQCPNCKPQLTGTGIHLFAHRRSWLSSFQKCPSCHELTVERTTTILAQPTTSNPGEQLVTDKCYACAYRREEKEILPMLPQESSSGFSSSGFSGGDFGGGSSGGGGAGGSW